MTIILRGGPLHGVTYQAPAGLNTVTRDFPVVSSELSGRYVLRNHVGHLAVFDFRPYEDEGPVLF